MLAEIFILRLQILLRQRPPAEPSDGRRFVPIALPLALAVCPAG